MAVTHHLWMEDVSAIVRLVKPASTATPTSMNVKKVRTFVSFTIFGDSLSTMFSMKKYVFFERIFFVENLN